MMSLEVSYTGDVAVPDKQGSVLQEGICKEYTEFSAHERAHLTRVSSQGSTPSVRSSDDYQNVVDLDLSSEPDFSPQEGEDFEQNSLSFKKVFQQPRWSDFFGLAQAANAVATDMKESEAVAARIPSDTEVAAEPSCTSTASSRPCFCAEFMEYSERELSMLLDQPQQSKSPVARSSDDYGEEDAGIKTTFMSTYHQACMVSTSGSVKRVRRVFHNRRKTAWTDYDEDFPSEATKAAEKEAQEKPMEPEQETALVKLLKAGGNPTAVEVKKVAFEQAGLPGGGYQGTTVLKSRGACGWTPLLIAVHRKQLAAAQALLDLGADVDEADAKSGWTPLMYAAGAGNAAMVDLLLQNGAAANAVAPKHAWSPLCSAIQSGKKDIVLKLIAAGADIKAVKRQHPAIADIYRNDMC
eukprot:CAMPEP_0206611248 /NCGR_PEP_ID=MMETSP0325_2-20121206/55122_1 /ASSEMBLY_ACC=CAM_ASM_000347 /TAXON_ID=2866 /ORGANISM="Crypthecodinium cohnii, Strain Seligo" /LENGTH=409 /DNA_ID=CAMNT_0054130395 /DNA_START=3 /DNA_END=1232 /DNA_ORIENTATION=-